METDEQVIARKGRDKAVRAAWRKFRPKVAGKIAARKKRGNLRWLKIGEVIRSGDLRRTKKSGWLLAPPAHIGCLVRCENYYRRSILRPPPT